MSESYCPIPRDILRKGVNRLNAESETWHLRSMTAGPYNGDYCWSEELYQIAYRDLEGARHIAWAYHKEEGSDRDRWTFYTTLPERLVGRPDCKEWRRMCFGHSKPISIAREYWHNTP